MRVQIGWVAGVLASFYAAGIPLRAIDIAGYSAEKNNLFSSGFSTDSPVRNTGTSFIGAGYDWTGLGWVADAPNGRVTHVTLISPLHTLSARHASVTLLGTETRFVGGDGEVIDIGLAGTSRNPSSGTTSNDLNIAELDRAVTATEGITPLRILDTSSGNYTAQPLFMVGSDSMSVGSQVATSSVSSTSGSISTAKTNSQNSTLSFVFWEGGDSGSPALIPYHESLTVAGIAYYPTAFTPVAPTGSYDPVPGINSILAETGYALKWTVYDEPGDSANTANVWTGIGGSGNLSDSSNWSQPQKSIAGKPVVFDAASAAGQTNISLGTAAALRGALFRESGSPDGFTFSGQGVLTLGATGLRNESSATQTFGVPISLSASQNWEAENGELAILGSVSNGGFLLSVGGASDTLISGVISGSGGLAKDGAGTLTLAAANSYSGTTFLHDGTLRLGVGASLGSGGVAFIAGNGASLDLGGQAQTVSSLTSAYGGTGNVLLGGGNLTVNSAADGRYDGSIQGSGSVVKTGVGTWVLAGQNTHAGAFEVDGGVVRLLAAGALSDSCNLVFNGGLLELGAGDFTRSLGTGAGEVRFSGVGIGGFSAFGGTRAVNLGGTGGEVTWGAGGFVPDGTGFRLSSATSDSTIEFQNPINLAGAYRSFVVNNGSAAIDARLTGSVRNGSLVKYGAGVLELASANLYTGHTQIGDGGLLISAEGALGNGNLVFVGSGGGVLVLGTGDFTRSLGSGDGQVRFVTGGGFAAFGGNRAVNLGGARSVLTWGQGNFVPDGNLLVLSSTGISSGSLDFQNPINLNGGNRTFQVGDGIAGIDSILSGELSNGGLIKTGSGTLDLAAANTYSGQTSVNGGTLMATHVSGLGNGNLNLSGGGIYMAATGDFTRSLGTGPGQVQFSGSGGFAAFGADRKIDLGGNGATLTWGSGGFVTSGGTFYLGANSADSTVDFANSIDLGAATRTVWVNDGSATVDARISGSLSNGSIIKTGAGLLELTAANSYTGSTSIAGGILRISGEGALPQQSRIILSGGGVLEIGSGNFTRSLGTGSGQVQFAADGGGFSAIGSTLAVNLGGAKATVVWGVANTGIIGRLVLGSSVSTATVDWQNPINLGTEALGTRTIEVADGSAGIDARISGVIYTGGVGWGLQKTGAGTLEIAAGTSYTGATTVSAGTLIVGSAGTMTGTKNIAVETGATFDYRSTALSLSRSVSVQGGAFLYNSQLAFSGSLAFESGTIGGSGKLGTTALTVGAGRTISPGNSAGTLFTGSQTWENGGKYRWEIESLGGSAGALGGWDLLGIQGDLTILADPAGFTLSLESSGALSGWDPLVASSWEIASVTGSIAGFSPGAFTVDAGGFAETNDLAGGHFSVIQSGSVLELVFTPIPEPATGILAAIGFASLAATGRRFVSRLSKKNPRSNTRP